MTADDFRSVMRRFPTGVAVVTTILDGKPKGFTANAVASVSAEPPTVLVCVNRQARSHPLIAAAGRFCINVLRLEQRDLAVRFASHEPVDPLESIGFVTATTGAPVIENAFAYLDCELAEEYSAGTHTIFIGAVQACEYGEGEPLGYFDGGYRNFGCRIP